MAYLNSYLKKLSWAHYLTAFFIVVIFVTTLVWVSRSGSKPQPLGSSAAGTEVVLYASNATSVNGSWNRVNDSSAAEGQRLYNPNANAAKLNSAQSSPANYFEVTFNAEAGTPYHVWLRLKADDNAWQNDSVFVQFSDSISDPTNPNNSAIYRIGTTSAMVVQLEEGMDAGVNGWGWNDNNWGSLGSHVYFQQSGTHTLRVQQREDGVSIDQIVISPTKYLTLSPGALKQDNTIVPKPAPPPPPPPPPTTTTLTSQNIGSTALAGSMAEVNGTYTITASGTDIWASEDGFRYSYQPLNGDGTLVARIVSAQFTDDFTLAGVMIRESLTPGSGHASMLVTPNGRAKFRYRSAPSGSTVSVGPGVGTITLPRWVKVVRQGNNFSGHISADGNTWQSIGSATVAMGANVYAGIAVTSHTNLTLTTAVVDGYRLITATPTAPPPHLSVSPSSLSFTAVSGTAPSAQTVTLSNSGGSPLTWNRSTSQGWCHADPASGSISPQATVNLSVWLDAQSSSGTCSISITGNADNTPQNVSVSYTVTPASTSSPTTLRSVTWNLAQSSNYQAQIDKLFEFMAPDKPDIIALVESLRSQETGTRDYLRSKTGVAWYSYFNSHKSANTSIQEGLTILSRFPLSGGNVKRFPCVIYTPYCDPANNQGYGAIYAKADLGNNKFLNIFDVHLYVRWNSGDAITSGQQFTIQDDQMRQLKTWASTFSGSNLLAGDFNQWAIGANITNDVCSLPVMVNETPNYDDLWTVGLRTGKARSYTTLGCQTPTKNGRIDYLFLPRGTFTLKDVYIPDAKSIRLPDQTLLSDHNPVISTFDLIP